MIMHKETDKMCPETTAVIEAISVAVILLDAFLSFKLGNQPIHHDAPKVDIPIHVTKWLRHMHHLLNKPVMLALVEKAIISPA